MQTIITYNENEVTELKNLQNVKSEDKIWIDLVDPSDDVLQSFVTHFHLDQSAVELFTNKSKKPQIRLLEDHTFTILLDIKYKDSQTVFTEGVYLFCGNSWLITNHSAEVDLVKSTRKLLDHENKRLAKDSIEALFYSILFELIDRYEQVLTAVELTMTRLARKSTERPCKDTINYLGILSRQLIVFRRHFWRIRDVVNFLTHIEKDTDEVKYIQMAYDNQSNLEETKFSLRKMNRKLKNKK